MKSLSERRDDANSLLAPHAVQHRPETHRTPDSTRLIFQRDRDRITSTEAYLRLTGKMQVLPPGYSDIVRNRRTHTDDVSFNSRNDARALALNEDLVECLALMHDLGHPPFGHAGEDALKEVFPEFEHNQQALRIVTLLETHVTEESGIGLSSEVLEGSQKHGARMIHMEGQLVDANDEKTYTAHDLQDALRAKFITFDDVRSVALGARAIEKAGENIDGIRGALLDFLTQDLLSETERRIARLNIQSLQDVYTAVERVVDFSAEMRAALQEMRTFLFARFYNHPGVLRETAAGKKMIAELFRAYQRKPLQKILALQQRTSSSLDQAIADYIAGMTDDFAKKAHTKLTA
jgi:dGTPase